MKVLNLYAGLGGNRKLWTGVDVTAIEYNEKIAAVYQRLNPQDTVIVADAHQYLLDHYAEFDVIWSSPPCQGNTRTIRSGRNRRARYPDLRLYEDVIFLQHNFKGKWVVENVVPYYTPLIPATKIGRHLFWSNSPIEPFDEPKQPANFINMANVAGKIALMDWLGIHYEENIYYEGNHCPAQVLRNCVHPLTGLHVFNQIIK
jgi:DNA (cytosine-5)-methyltransferase 1